MKGIELIEAERKRQIEKEGFDAHHDWHHTPDELATAGAIRRTELWKNCF